MCDRCYLSHKCRLHFRVHHVTLSARGLLQSLCIVATKGLLPWANVYFCVNFYIISSNMSAIRTLCKKPPSEFMCQGEAMVACRFNGLLGRLRFKYALQLISNLCSIRLESRDRNACFNPAYYSCNHVVKAPMTASRHCHKRSNPGWLLSKLAINFDSWVTLTK